MSILMVDHYRRVCGEDKNIEMYLAKKMGLNIEMIDGLHNYGMLAGIVFDSKKRRHTKKVLLDSSLDARHKKFYLACLISKMVLSKGKGEQAVVIGQNSRFGKNTIAMTKYILGSEIEVDDIIEDHNPTIKPRQYIKLDMNVKAN